MESRSEKSASSIDPIDRAVIPVSHEFGNRTGLKLGPAIDRIVVADG